MTSASATIVAAFGFAVLAACDGGASVITGGAPPPGGGVPCPVAVPLQQLVYPAPGSTAIPAALGTLVVAGPIASLTLQPALGTALVASTPTAVPSPIPAPNATPRTNPLGAFAAPVLSAATTYTVTAQAPGTGPCVPGPQTLGSFTTQ
jgi:hypothetical protein